MKQFACGSVVPGCDEVVTGESEDELMAAVASHAREAHGMTEVPDDVAARVREGITEV